MSLQQSYIIVLLALLAGCGSHSSPPLWPGSKYTEADRTKAMLRALDFIDKSASNRANFAAQDNDYLYCFYSIIVTAKDPELRAAAARIAPKYARQWATTHPNLPANAGTADIAHLVFGWQPASALGESDARIKPELQRAAARFTAIDFLLFDPAKEPPPSDLPEPCKYDQWQNPRGATVCKKCGHKLVMKTRYEVWLDALIDTYSGDIYGVRLGGAFADVLKWIPAMRPYPDPRTISQGLFLDVLYSLTHIVYTLNDYGRYQLPHNLLPEEFAYLRQNLGQAIALHDPETMGEFLDALKGFGLTNSDPVIQQGITYLLDTQRPDGTWGSANEKDYYTLYHSAWTGIDGLKDCCWGGERLSLPELKPLLDSIRNAPPQRLH